MFLKTSLTTQTIGWDFLSKASVQPEDRKEYIYIYSDKLQYNCTVTRLYYITIQLYSDKAIEKTT